MHLGSRMIGELRNRHSIQTLVLTTLSLARHHNFETTFDESTNCAAGIADVIDCSLGKIPVDPIEDVERAIPQSQEL